MELLKALQWRYATKRYDSHVKLDHQKVMEIIEAARLAPTSSGLQPFEVILIKNQQLKQKLVPIAMNQPQVKECSDLLVFASWDSYTDQRIDKVFDNMEKKRDLAKDSMLDYKNSLKANFAALSVEQQANHAAKQAYIGFGMAIAAAAELRIDASPMEGFYNQELDKELSLDQKGLKSVCLLALGHRDSQEDWLLPLKKVRFDLDTFLTVIE
ncbi:nitroreductase family protein [Myroides sp. LJL119]